MAYLSPAQQEKLKKGLNIFGQDFTNSQGQTMAEANAPSSWSDGTYIGRKTNVITPDSLQNEDKLNLPKVNQDEATASTMNAIPSIEDIYKGNESETATEYDKMTNDYLKLFETYGVEKPKAQVEEEAKVGLPQYQAQLTDINSQINALKNEAIATLLQTEASMMGRASVGAIAGQSKAKLRENTVKALQLSSVQQTILGNIANAQKQADKAVELEFAPMQAKIDYLKEALRVNASKLTREEAKQAKIQDAKVAERQTLLDQQKEDKKTIMNIAIEASKSGVDALTLNKIQKAGSIAEATRIAAEAGVYQSSGEQFTLSPGQVRYDSKGNVIAQAGESQLDLAKFELDKAKIQAEIDKIYNDIKLSGDPNSFENQKKLLEVKKLQQDINTQQAKVDAQKISQGQAATVLDEKIKTIDGLIKDTSKYGDSVVGTNRFARNTWLNPFSKLDTLTGKAQNFIGSVEQLVSKETMDMLVNLKAKGGTLGALSDQERLMLQNAATKIGKWAVKDKNGNVIGYNIDEKSFKKELENIKSLAETAKQNAGSSYYNTFNDFLLNASDEQIDAAEELKLKYPGIDDNELLELINQQSFNGVGGDTNSAVSKALTVPDGKEGGQCGRFVNKYTGLGLGDSYQSKLDKMDSSITYPEPGMVFVMPYGSTGHTGFIQSVNNDGTVTVKDSNFSSDEKVKTHKIAISKITGLRRV